MKILLLSIVCLAITFGGASCKGKGVFSSDSKITALEFVNALQIQNFAIIWTRYLPYQKQVETIRNENAKPYWQSAEQKAYSKERKQQYPKGGWARWSSLLKDGSFKVIDERSLGSDTKASVVFVEVAYPNRETSPLVKDVLLEKLVLRMTVGENGSAVVSIDRAHSSDVPWSNNEATRIELARRYYKAGKNLSALRALPSPTTREGKTLRGNILYSYYAREALIVDNKNAVAGIKEALRINPKVRPKLYGYGLSLLNQYETSNEWWVKEKVFPLLNRLVVFFPNDTFIRGKMVQHALISSEYALCRGYHPNEKKVYGSNVSKGIDVAKKWGSNSMFTQNVINQLLSTYSNARTRDEYRKKCDPMYHRGPLHAELKQKAPEQFAINE
ncbi:hypothetical protein MYX76_09585 [Desulfobacterota bacterium AH_259_B03_O07]|nr:hypothetical protein [Desulfobacterota bacterium AH_259_B03_O07]